MDLNNARRMGKQPYEAVRGEFDRLGEQVIERHWDAGAPVRQGYRRFLGALDELAGRLLDDDEIAQRGQDLLRETEADGTAESGEAEAKVPDDAKVTGEGTGADRADGTDKADGTDRADGTAADEAGDSVWTQASGEADDRAADEVRRTEEARQAEEARRADEAQVGESWAAGNARVAGETGAEGATEEAARTVAVVFSLPAETVAERVALCGEFNDWSVESISLARGDDRTWRVTVPLAPGSYRYKFLLDGETWENGSDADRYEDNAYGTVDSVVVVTE